MVRRINGMNSLCQKLQIPILLALAVILLAVGCEKKTAKRLRVVEDNTTSTVRVRPCNVLLSGLDSLADLMERQWASRHETPLTITNVGLAEFEESNMEVANDINVLVLSLIHI